VILDRIETRATNDFGKRRGEHELVLAHLASVEPLPRATCTHEIDATLVAIGRGDGARRDRAA